MDHSWKYGYRPYRRHSPWMGFVFVFLLILLVTKGFALLWPLVLIGLGFMMLKGKGIGFCDGEMGEKFKRKNEEGKSKRYYDDADEPVEYI